MQNAVNKNEKENLVGISSAHVSDAIRRVHESNAMFAKEVIDNASRVTDSVCIIKKDGTKEQFNEILNIANTYIEKRIEKGC